MAKITLRQLKLAGACNSQVELFRATFGNSVEVTLATCLEHAQKFDWTWAARHILSPAAWAEYEKVCDAAWAEKVRASAWAEYNKARDAAWAEYDKICAAAGAEYDKICAAAGAEYDKICASAFYAGWEADHK